MPDQSSETLTFDELIKLLRGSYTVVSYTLQLMELPEEEELFIIKAFRENLTRAETLEQLPSLIKLLTQWEKFIYSLREALADLAFNEWQAFWEERIILTASIVKLLQEPVRKALYKHVPQTEIPGLLKHGSEVPEA